MRVAIRLNEYEWLGEGGRAIASLDRAVRYNAIDETVCLLALLLVESCNYEIDETFGVYAIARDTEVRLVSLLVLKNIYREFGRNV